MESVCVLLIFFYYPCSRLGARRLQIERLWRRCLCGQLKQGAGDSSKAPWGHLWNRLTNVSLLCHKDTRLTKRAINAPFTTHLFVTQVFIPAVSCTVLPWLTRPRAICRPSSKEGSPRRTVLDDSCRILMGSPCCCCQPGHPPSRLSGVGGGNITDGDENVAQRLHSHSGIHAFNKSKEGEGRKKRQEKKVKRGQPVV